MPPLKIKEGNIKGFKYEDGDYVINIKFSKDQIGSIAQKGMEYYCGRPVMLEVNEIQQELDLNKPKTVNPEDKKAEIIEIDAEFIKKSNIDKSQVGAGLVRGNIKRAFEYNDGLYVAFESSHNQGDNKHSEYKAVQLVPVDEYKDQVYTLKQKEKLPKEEQRPYHKGIKIKYKRKEYVLGLPFHFVEKKEVSTKAKKKDSKAA